CQGAGQGWQRGGNREDFRWQPNKDVRAESGKPLTMVPANGATQARSSGEGTRNSKVVQCFEGLRLHPTPNWRRCVRALLCHHDGRLQVAERRAGGGVRSKERSERPSSRERNRPLSLCRAEFEGSSTAP